VSESPRGTQAFIKASDGWHPVVSSEELEATIRKLRKVEAERNAAREDLERTKRVLDKIDAVRTHQSEKLVRVYEASGAEPQHFDCIDKFVGAMQGIVDRLTAERDEARRELCIEHLSPEAEARRRGWDCFKEVKP